ncbi:MAG: cyclic nucleotide-binding domain-containing protein [Actinomycetota bacterium]
MRVESSVTSVSWIPSEAITGVTKVPFEVSVAHYDKPLPDVIDDLEGLKRSDRFRFANELRAYIEVEDGRVVGHGHLGRGHIGSTTLRLGSREMSFAAVPFSTLQAHPEVTQDSVRFVQTAGGRTGVPAPRPVPRPPFFQFRAPTAWTTLSLTLHADGTVDQEVVGASPFPRHWIYDDAGTLVAKTGLIDYKSWARDAWGKKTPWGDEDSSALVTEVETALERELSEQIMRGGAKPKIVSIGEGETLVEQGDTGHEVMLLLDGLLDVEVDGNVVAETGPGAVLGERALLEGGRRSATLRARTPCRVAVVAGDQIDERAMAQLAEGHRREEA